MPRYRHPPMTLQEIFVDGPPVKVRDLAAISGLTRETVSQDIRTGCLTAFRRDQQFGSRSIYLVHRRDAQRWLMQLGFSGQRAS